MKRFVFGFVALGALSALALPASTSDLIQGLLKNSAFKELLKSHEETILAHMHIERQALTESVRKLCATNSRSAGALKVTFSMRNYHVEHIFATDGSPEELRLCNQPM